MQDPSSFPQIKPPFPEHEHLRCPRCDSTNTKFCYYNNYNLSQPRHFCKNCRRYWTKGGALRDIPVGGGNRKNRKRSSKSKRSSPSSSNPSSSSSVPAGAAVAAPGFGNESQMLDVGWSFSSLLASNGQFGNFLNGLNSNGSAAAELGDIKEDGNGMINLEAELHSQGTGNSDSFLGVEGGGDFGSSWPDLAIYTPGSSTFQ